MRLISTGRSGEELGDILFPYVVADSLDAITRLERLGVETLHDAPSAAPIALSRALFLFV